MTTYTVHLSKKDTKHFASITEILTTLFDHDPSLNGATFELLRNADEDCTWVNGPDELNSAIIFTRVSAHIESQNEE